MKLRMRILSALLCLAMLISAAPADAFLAAYAEEAATEAPAPVAEVTAEPESPAAPEVPAEQQEPAETEEAEEPPATEEPPVTEEIPATEETAEPVEPEEGAGEGPVEPEAPVETDAPAAPVEPEEDPNAIDYAADAGKSPAFTQGFAEVMRDDTPVYETGRADAEAKAKLGGGVVYVLERASGEGQPDRVRVAFNAGPEVGVDEGWVDAARVRPMEPEQEVPAYLEFCRDQENLLFYRDLAELPLARISCAYPEADATIEPEASPEAPAEGEATPEPLEGGHPVVWPIEEDASGDEPGEVVEDEPQQPAVEDVPTGDAAEGDASEADGEAADPGISTMPLPLDEPLFTLDEVAPQIAQDELQMYVGRSQQLNLTLPEDAAVTLTSSDIRVATVSQTGVVTAIAPGDAVITLAAGDEVDTCSVSVDANTKVSFTVSELKLGVGEEYDLHDIVACDAEDAVLEFATSSACLEIPDKAAGVLHAKSAGTGVVTVSVIENGANASLNVTVLPAATSVTIKDQLTLSDGMTASLGVSFLPAGSLSSYTLESSNPELVSVNQVDGTVTAHEGTGTATITITTANNLTDTCAVTVVKQPVEIEIDGWDRYEEPDSYIFTLVPGETGRRIDAAALKDGIEVPCELEYEVTGANKSIVSVDPNGVLTTLGSNGETEITIRAKGVAGVEVKCKVEVVSVASGIKLQRTAISLGVGDTFQIADKYDGIIETVGGPVQSYSYSSTRTKYATVSASGLITAKKAGYSDIVITPSGGASPVTLRVNVSNAAGSVSFDHSELTIGAGQSATLKVVFPSKTAADYYITSSDEEDEEPLIQLKRDEKDPNTWTITAAEKFDNPTVTLTVHSRLRGYEDTCAVTIVPGPTQIEISANKTVIGQGEPGGKVTVSVKEGNNVGGFKFESSNPNALAVDENGNLTVKSAGAQNVTITATATAPNAAGRYATATTEEFTLTPLATKFEVVGALSMGIGDTYSLADDTDGFIKLTPADAHLSYTYAASAKSNKIAKTSVIAVDATGKITAKKAGTAYVLITPTTSGLPRCYLKVAVAKATGTVTLSKSSLRLGVGMTDTLTVSFSSKTYGRFVLEEIGNEQGVLDCAVSGQKITLTAKQPGTVTINVRTQRGYVDSCTVTVVEAPAKEDIQFDVPAQIGVGEQGMKVSAVCTDEKKLGVLTYESNAPATLAVDPTTGALTAKAKGNATISVKCTGSEAALASEIITVVDAPEKIAVEPASLTIEVGRTYQINTSEIALTPETARASYGFSTANKKYAAVSATGLITGVKVGKNIRIRVYSKQNTAVYDDIYVTVVKKGTSFAVNPAALTLGVGMSSKVSAAKIPAGTLTYESSTPAVVEVTNPETGEIKAKGAGTALITAKVTSGEGDAMKTTVSAAATVTVLPAPTAEEITFTADSTTRICANQKNAKVTATIPSGTKAEIAYRVDGDAPGGLTLNEATGALTYTGTATNGSFTVVAYDKNNSDVTASHEVSFAPAAKMVKLKQSAIYLGVGETYRIPDNVELDSEDGSASFSYASYKTYKKGKLSTKNSTYATVNATTGVVTGRKAGTNYIQVACHNGGSAVLTVKVYKAPATAVLSPATLELGAGMTGQLKSNYASGNRYESSNDLVATVDEATGLVTATGDGYATITLTTWNGKTDTSLIHVMPAPETVDMAPTELTIGMKQKGAKVVATPGEEGTMAAFTYESDRPDIVTVDAKTGALTPVAPGTDVTIRATAQGNPGVTGTTTVTVKAAPSGLTLKTGSIKLGIGDTYQINDGEIVDILPSDEDTSTVHASYSYYASTKSNKNKKTSVATVSATGLITGKKAGTAYVRISDQAGHVKAMKVLVYKRATSATLSKSSLLLSEGMETKITVNLPKNTWVGFEVVSSNPDAVDVVVSGQTVTVTALEADAEATITLRTVNGLVDTCHVSTTPVPKMVSVQLAPGTGSYLADPNGTEITIGVGESNARIIASPVDYYLPCNFEYVSEDTKTVTVSTTGVLSARAAKQDPTKVTVKVKYGQAYIDYKTAQGEAPTPPEKSVTVYTVAGPAKGQLTLAQGTVTMGVGDTYQIEEYHLDENGQGVGVIKIPDGTSASYTYKSSNTKVATVSAAGVVTAKKAGTTKIRITAQNNKKVYKDLTISVKNYTTSLSILPAVTLGAEMTGSVGTKFSSNAYGLVEYVSSNPEIVAVNPSTGALTAASAEDIDAVEHATITATLLRAGKTDISDTCYVTVVPEPTKIGIDYVRMTGVETDENGERFVRVGAGESGVAIVPECLEPDPSMCDYEYTVNRAGMSVSAAGVITASTASAEYYTVTVNAKSAKSVTATVNVLVVAAPTGVSFAPGTLTLGVGDVYQLKETADGGIIKLNPDTSSASYSYSASSNKTKSKSTSVLSVSGTGLITAKKAGTAYVKVVTQNKKVYGVLTVKVLNKPASISLSPETLTIGELSEGKVSVVYPANTHSEIAGFASSDADVLSVDLSGNITVEKLPDGKAKDVTITATTQSGVSGKATVTVLPHPSSVEFAQSSYELSAGMTLATAYTLPEGTLAQHFKYVSDKPEVVEIDENGVLTGTNAEGEDQTATITITANPDDEAYAVTNAVPVTVTVHPAPDHITYEGVGLPEGGLVIAKGDTVAIPEPLAYTAGDKLVPANFTFTSGKTSIVTVKDGKMTAVAAGTTTIEVAAHNSSSGKPITTTLKVTVSANMPTKLELFDGDVPVGDNSKPGALAMYVNEQNPTDTVTLTAKVTGTDVNCGSVSFESNAPETVSVDASGVVTALKTGTATITATTGKGGLTATCEVTVGKLCDEAVLKNEESITLNEGETQQIEFTFQPQGTGMRMKYASDAPEAVTVSDSGLITAVGGSANIIITGQCGWTKTIAVKALHNPDSASLSVRTLYMKAPVKNEELDPETRAETYTYDEVVLKPVLSKRDVKTEDIYLWSSLTVTSGDKSVVEVTEATEQSADAPATYTVKAVGKGTATLTLKTNDPTVTATCTIIVGDPDGEPGFAWAEEQELVIMKGDTAPLEFCLTSDAYNGEGGYSVEQDSEGAQFIELDKSDWSIEAKEVGSSTFTLKVGEESKGSVTVTVINPEAPKLYYGKDLKEPVPAAADMDVSTFTADFAKHEIRIDPYSGDDAKNGEVVLLGVYEVSLGDPAVLSLDREHNRISTGSRTGTSTVTVQTFGGTATANITVLGAPVYRALLITEYNETKNRLPFMSTNVNIMKKTLGASNIGGQKYTVEGFANASEASIKNKIATFFKGAKKNDVSVIYFASHGHMGSGSHKGEFAFSMEGFSLSKPATYITDTELMSFIKGSDAINGNVVLLLDGCNTGAFITHQSSALSKAGNIAVMTAQVGSKSASFHVGGAGLSEPTFEFFTYSFCLGMGYDQFTNKWGSGAAADAGTKDGYITLTEAYNYAKSKTSSLAVNCATNHYSASKSYGFKAPSVTNTTKRNTWKKNGGQVPQKYIPSAMANLVLFCKN